MKKRKPIKLEGQQNTAQKAFRSRIRNVKRLLTRLSCLTNDMQGDFEKTGMEDWGFAGSMANVEEQLIESVNFLSNGKGVERL
jgi:hypothetical protein